MRFAEIAVNSPAARWHTFSYSYPDDVRLAPGQPVWVPFGPQVLQGMVVGLSDHTSVAEVRDIVSVMDPEPLLSPQQVELAQWLQDYYLCSPFESLSLMLPPAFERKMLTFLHPKAGAPDNAADSLDPPQREALLLVRQKGKVGVREIEKAMGKKQAKLAVNYLLHRGLVTKSQEMERLRAKPKLVPVVKAVSGDVVATALREMKPGDRTRHQRAVLELLLQEPSLLMSEVRKRTGCAPSTITALRRKGLVSVDTVSVPRDPLAGRRFVPSSPLRLYPAQEAALNEIQAGLQAAGQREPPAAFLLHGVTGSGKTEVYLRALAHTISLGKKGIVLVPEISLTPQTIERFASRFPGRVAVLHSRLSLGEQFDEWQRIKRGDCDVVIGSRSAIFSPQPRLGLIVIDEEHEWTYKQEEQSPRYHARRVALELGRLCGAVVVLGSATPDLETFRRSERGDIRLLRMPERVAGGVIAPLPRVELVDLREELKAGNRTIFSRALSQALSETLAAKEQAILFLNRRGSATFVQCRRCGFVMRCRRCSVTLTYHSEGTGLFCHQCNYRTPVPAVCPQCHSPSIKFLGIGTQKVESEVGLAFPQARILRWDRDAVRQRHSQQEIVDKFTAHEADILIGTQMIAKGLDFPAVTLVGVVSADLGLNYPDFRSVERTFQLVTQVAGRAGRGPLGGRVIVQTYTPEHYALQAAASHDYETFYRKEMAYRRQLNDPPFSQLARLVYSHTNDEACRREAERVAGIINGWSVSSPGLRVEVMGPVPALIGRIRGKYRWQLVLKGRGLSEALSELTLPQGWAVDIDPLSLT